jgi:hypothetical protein
MGARFAGAGELYLVSGKGKVAPGGERMQTFFERGVFG